MNISNKEQWQLQLFQTGIEPMHMVGAAVGDDGILRLDETRKLRFSEYYHQRKKKIDIVKFVPASGAATRMFKFLFEGIQGKESDDWQFFFENLRKFPFFNTLKSVAVEQSVDLEQLIQQKEYRNIAQLILEEEGLNYGNLPKALIDFHTVNGEVNKPIDEHLIEGAKYANGNIVNIHFTVSPEHLRLFEDYIQSVIDEYEERFGIEYNITFSFQKKETDTIAVTQQNRPVRKTDGEILRRPAGHGALLENLNEIDADIIFIKNIDNVCKHAWLKTTVEHKQILAGVLLDYKQLIFETLEYMDENLVLDQEELNRLAILVKNRLGLVVEPVYDDIYNALNRPIRVCGMVPNTGEPGGGPYWVTSADRLSLQIVESAQMNLKDPVQMAIVDKATHFNPVDIVCTKTDYKGQPFDLREYRDMSACFIASKSYEGKKIKALELPGLWNGAMANWNTVFVEVPLKTFNPVKTVNDLLKPGHFD